jgi:hypothetical protein
MSVFLQPIYTQTVGAGGASSITFNNIPQGYTDLVVKISSRSTSNSPSTYLTFNGDTNTNFSDTWLAGTGAATTSTRLASSSFIRFDASGQGPDDTSNVFGNVEIYIPNYASSNYKQITYDSVKERNGNNYNYASVLGAALWRNTNPITLIYFGMDGNIVQYSTFSLYGVLRQGI